MRLDLVVGTGGNMLTIDAFLTSAQIGVTAVELSSVSVNFTMDGDLVGGLN